MDSTTTLSASQLHHIPTAWLLTGLLVSLFLTWKLLAFLNPPIHNLTAMRLSEIYVYPIKSLRAVPLKSAVATKYGFDHDRVFMLLKKKDDGTWQNMTIGHFSDLSQFIQEFEDYGTNDATIKVTYRAFGDQDKAKTLRIPLVPDTEKLDSFHVNMHGSPTDAFHMGDKYSQWFTSCFGYSVILVYIGSENKRAVGFEDMQPLPSSPLTALLNKNMPFLGHQLEKLTGMQTEERRIKFQDCAPFLITSQTSLDNVSSRLDGATMDMIKFRPNMVVAGATAPWQEDYWAQITINHKTDLLMAHNCVRCKSINIDYTTGKPGAGPSGEVLKRMQKDRRVDTGAKWSPVFGRYTFWAPGAPERQTLSVGDAVRVTKVNKRRTVWSWPGIG